MTKNKRIDELAKAVFKIVDKLEQRISTLEKKRISTLEKKLEQLEFNFDFN